MLQKYIILQYLPLTLFVWLIRFQYDWPMIFIVAGTSALLFLFVLWKQKNIIDRFVLAIYLFLIGGAVMFIGNVGWLQAVYEYFDKAMLLLWLFFVGIISTIITPQGFIGVESIDKRKQKSYSYYLLIATMIGLIWAFYRRENIFLAGMVPFLALRLLQIILRSLLKNQA